MPEDYTVSNWILAVLSDHIIAAVYLCCFILTVWLAKYYRFGVFRRWDILILGLASFPVMVFYTAQEFGALSPMTIRNLAASRIVSFSAGTVILIFLLIVIARNKNQVKVLDEEE